MPEQDIQNLQQTSTNLAEIFLQQSARLIDIQAAALRAMLRTQARSSAALGGPDWSGLWEAENERQFSELLRTTTEKTVNFMRQTNQAFSQSQQAFTQLMARQTGELTAQIRTNAEEISQRIEQSAAEARRASQQAADVVQQAAGGMEGGRPKRMIETK